MTTSRYRNTLTALMLLAVIGCGGPGPAERIVEDDNAPSYSASHILIMHQQSTGALANIRRSKQQALEFAKEMAEKARADGADFAELARFNSDDHSKKDGGKLGVFKLSGMVAPFSEATAKLEIGEVSDPVETMYGFHVILREPLPAKATVSQILVMHSESIYKDDSITRTADEAKARAEECATRAAAGEDFAELAKEMSDDSGAKVGGLLGEISEDDKKLPKQLVDAWFALEVGGCSQVIETDFGYHVLRRDK